MEKTTRKLQKLFSGLFLLLLSYALLALLFVWRDVNILSWAVFAVSAFIFCIGAYWVGSVFNGPTGDAFVKTKRIVLRVLCVVLCAVGGYIAWWDNFNGRGIIVATLLVIQGITAWMISDARTYNAAMDGMKQVPSMTSPLDEVFRAFEHVETPLGFPWMGKVRSIEDECIVYGPTRSGSFLYCWYHTGEFMVSECDDESEEVFKITRRLLHALPHYDLYHYGEEYGRVAKQFDLTHESFKMDTPDGLLEMREITTTFGDQFVVYLNDYLIGTISERMTLHIRDAVYDNFVIMAFEPQRVALMATLTVMLQSFKDRD